MNMDWFLSTCIYVNSNLKRQKIIAAIVVVVVVVAVTVATVATFTFDIHSVTSTSASSICPLSPFDFDFNLFINNSQTSIRCTAYGYYQSILK